MSRMVAEVAIALRIVSEDELPAPPQTLDTNTKNRVAKTVESLSWRVEARAALNDPQVQELAFLFYQICLNSVPTNSTNPLTDDDWLLRVREFFVREEKLQIIANALLDQFPFPEVYQEAPLDLIAPQSIPVSNTIPAAPPIAVTPQPAAIAAPSITETNSPSLSTSPGETQPEIMARLKRLTKTKRLVDQLRLLYRAYKARMHAAREDAQPEMAHISATPTIETIPPPVESVTAPVSIREAEAVVNRRRTKRVVVHRARRGGCRNMRRYRQYLEKRRSLVHTMPYFSEARAFLRRQPFRRILLSTCTAHAAGKMPMDAPSG